MKKDTPLALNFRWTINNFNVSISQAISEVYLYQYYSLLKFKVIWAPYVLSGNTTYETLANHSPMAPPWHNYCLEIWPYHPFAAVYSLPHLYVLLNKILLSLFSKFIKIYSMYSFPVNILFLRFGYVIDSFSLLQSLYECITIDCPFSCCWTFKLCSVFC